jgi:hypothetical protein
VGWEAVQRGLRFMLPACLNGQPHNSSATLLLDALLRGPTAASAVSSRVSAAAAAAVAAAVFAGRTQVVPPRALLHCAATTQRRLARVVLHRCMEPSGQ